MLLLLAMSLLLLMLLLFGAVAAAVLTASVGVAATVVPAGRVLLLAIGPTSLTRSMSWSRLTCA